MYDLLLLFYLKIQKKIPQTSRPVGAYPLPLNLLLFSVKSLCSWPTHYRILLDPCRGYG